MEDEETGELFIPCRECSKKCYKIHGKYHEKEHFDEFSSFFKVLIGDFAEKLRIPLAFVSKLVNEKDKHMVLEGPDGRGWEVELTSTNNKLEFQGGWKEFVHYHSLEMGDFVVFKYIAMSYMKVHMFGRSGCVKNINVLDFEKPKIDSNKRCPSNKICSLNQTSGNKLVTDLTYDEEKNQCEAVAGNQKRKRKPSFLGSSSQKCMTMESAASFKSDKPFYKMVMKPWNLDHYIKFGKRESQQYLIQLPNPKSEVVLLNGESKEWKVKCIIKADMPIFSGGWRCFVRDNKIKEGDTCIFEQLNNNENKFMFKVHIFPHE
ncbi:putative B3 domain-containing protein Os03g0621600 [Cryptomeria japonica]|uniref:putative B3 domain-containing protein Os03g0621600 n=1 Tax=Cryptomeria japonica TaxID=3369 RepID=UPI0027DA6506|nr:putative B3 domain-containing protein Os03g0621600 [Cryptomeria japonica]